MDRHETGEAHVIPIILSPVDWTDAPFAKLQAFPRDAKPITTWSNQNEAFYDVAQGIRRVVNQIIKKRQQDELEQQRQIKEQERLKQDEVEQQREIDKSQLEFKLQQDRIEELLADLNSVIEDSKNYPLKDSPLPQLEGRDSIYSNVDLSFLSPPSPLPLPADKSPKAPKTQSYEALIIPGILLAALIGTLAAMWSSVNSKSPSNTQPPPSIINKQ